MNGFMLSQNTFCFTVEYIGLHLSSKYFFMDSAFSFVAAFLLFLYDSHWPFVLPPLKYRFRNIDLVWHAFQYWARCTFICISQHWLRKWYRVIRQETITWASVDPDPCCHMASQSVNNNPTNKITVPMVHWRNTLFFKIRAYFLWRNSASWKNTFHTKYRSYIHMPLRVSSLHDWLRLPVWLRWFNRIWLFACKQW